MWKIYDVLIDGIPEDITVMDFVAGSHWVAVRSSEGGVGLAMRTDGQTMPSTLDGNYTGIPLKCLAVCAKSWNFAEASFGVAAINAYYNFIERSKSRGIKMPEASLQEDSFEKYRDKIAGKKVAVIGHFRLLESLLGPVCQLSILERRPRDGDYPDPACEYILPEQDYVFISASAMVNKTLPRLLALSEKAWTVLVGPSVTLASSLFDFGVNDLSGFIVRENEMCLEAVRDGNRVRQFQAGVMVNYCLQGLK
jgi:uncharacterized protein (DUF4213/DUF364 family)